MDMSVGRNLMGDGTAVVTITGEIDFTNADEVAAGIDRAVSEWQPPALRIDLAAASFIDSTGLGALIAGYQTVAESGAAFRVVNASAAFLRVLTVAGLAEVFGTGDPGVR